MFTTTISNQCNRKQQGTNYSKLVKIHLQNNLSEHKSIAKLAENFVKEHNLHFTTNLLETETPYQENNDQEQNLN